MGVGGCEIKTIGYTCRSVVLKVFGPGFNSRRLHQTALRACRRLFIALSWWMPADKIIQSLYSHISSFSYSFPLPHHTKCSGETGRRSDNQTCAKTVVRAAHHAAKRDYIQYISVFSPAVTLEL